jgi:hypothetical protein
MPGKILYRPYIDAYASFEDIADDYKALTKKVIQPSVAQKQQANRNAYSRVFHSNFVRNNNMTEAFEKLQNSSVPGGFLITPYKDNVIVV